jgi:hypothetical protein
LTNETLFSDAVLHQHVDATTNGILRVIADHLKQAPHRSGGAGKGCHLVMRTSALPLSLMLTSLT